MNHGTERSPSSDSSVQRPADVTESIDLVREAQAGDADALNRLCERYYDRVRRIVRMRLGDGLKKHVDASDILQDTFVVAVQEFDHFEMRDEASVINWLARLAERQILGKAEFFQAQKRDHRREVRFPTSQGFADSGQISWHLAASADAPLEKLSKEEQENAVENCIAKLAPEYRELLILRDYVGASWEAIAAQTGRPSGSAARMMHARALIELGRNLRSDGVS